MRDSSALVVRRHDYLPPPYTIDSVDLTFELDPVDTRVRAVSSIRRTIHGAVHTPLVLDGQHLRLVSIALDGKPLVPDAYVLTEDSLSIPGVPEAFILEIVASISPQTNKALEGLYLSGESFCTQCEAEGFRHITWFLDRPDVMARYRTTIVADRLRYPVLLSNGNCIERGTSDQGRHFAVWEDPFPKPCYLFALVAGDLARAEDTFVTCSGRTVDLHIFTAEENVDQTAHAMASLKRAMRWDEDTFGREYDLDVYMIVAVRDFNMGAMENKGLNIFNAKYVLAREDTATDADFQNVEIVVAHEYFHNWSGNRVTCRDWFQLSLKEGFTVFRDQEFASDVGVRAQKRVQDVQRLFAAQFPEDAGPTAHPVRPDAYEEINNFYTATVYEKGAEVVRMLHTLLGPERFRAGADLYFARHDGQAVTCDDFVRAMGDVSGRDLSQFALWYSQAGTPVVRARGHYDAATKEYTLSLGQRLPQTPGQAEKLPMHIPVRVGLLSADGCDLDLRLADEPPGEARTTRLLELTAPEQHFTFVDIPERPTASVLRGFSAPVRLESDAQTRDLLVRMAHDSDPYARWEASQSLSQRVVLSAMEELRSGAESTVDGGYLEAFGRALASDADPALLALSLTLPSEVVLTDQLSEVDPTLLHRARVHVERALGVAHASAFRDRYDVLAQPGAYELSPRAIGRRSLRNLCLRYLTVAEPASEGSRASAQFEAATNMTDMLAALWCLVSVQGSRRSAALERFYSRFAHDPLVVDKWFSVQAVADRDDVLQAVTALLGHPAFELQNPNRARALIDAFTTQNPGHFHDADGRGYAFLRARVCEVDRFNAQVAARLVAPLTRFGRIEPGRRARMVRELEVLASVGSLSRDVSEQVHKALQVAHSV